MLNNLVGLVVLVVVWLALANTFAATPVPGPMTEDQQLPAISDMKQPSQQTDNRPMETQRAEHERMLEEINRKLLNPQLDPLERVNLLLERAQLKRTLQSADFQ
jgi:hypothetical protein